MQSQVRVRSRNRTTSIAIALVVMALNFLGDGLRDAADPYALEGR